MILTVSMIKRETFFKDVPMEDKTKFICEKALNTSLDYLNGMSAKEALVLIDSAQIAMSRNTGKYVDEADVDAFSKAYIFLESLKQECIAYPDCKLEIIY